MYTIKIKCRGNDIAVFSSTTRISLKEIDISFYDKNIVIEQYNKNGKIVELLKPAK